MLRKIFSFILTSVLIQVLFVNSSRISKYDQHKGHEEEILKNIQEIHISGSPGFLTIYGNTTTSILGGERWDWTPKVHHGIVAANALGNGRIVGCSHTSLLSPYPDATPEQPGHLGTNQFILNTARWASQLESPNVLIIRNGGDQSLARYLNTSGMSANSISPGQLVSINDMNGFDVALITDPLNGNTHAGILLEFVEQNGKGLVMALTGWAYSQYTDAPGHFGHVFPANQISSKAGFVWRNGWGDGYARPTTPTGNFNVSSVFIKNINTGQVWPDVYEYLYGGEGSEEFKQNPDQFISIIEMDLKSIPPNDTSFFGGEYYQQMREFVLDLDRQPIPTGANPITSQHDKLLAHMFNLAVDIVLEPEEIPRHPASQFFPGVTANQNSQAGHVHSIEFRMNLTSGWSDFDSYGWENTCEAEKNKRPIRPFESDIELSTKHSLWFNTGLYAISGEVINITVITNSSIPLGVLIGCHTDDISRHDKWPRLPIITKRAGLFNNEVTKIASPYGGPLYITRPAEVPANEEIISVSIQGGYNVAPVFKLGQTSLKDWREKIRFIGSPWAEFESEKIILTAPQSSARNIDDPESVLLFWDSVMDAITELISIPRERTRQERMVPDILISAGFMHAGYPIMTFLPEGDMAINITRMRMEFNGWGHFHELGHNHQKPAWTFQGTGEVTCNLFALYIFNTVLGIPATKAHEMLTPEKYKPNVVEYIQTGTDFNKWKSDAWLAFLIYYQLQQEYGWGAYKQVFVWYNELGAGEQPGTEEEKIDLWIVMFSNVVGENLGPFFKSWGIPLTPGGQSQIDHFPEAPIRITDMIN